MLLLTALYLVVVNIHFYIYLLDATLAVVVIIFIVDAVFLVVPNVVVVALFIVNDPIIYKYGQSLFIWGS